MPRPPEFDRDTVLEKAMKLFWSQGYTATSLPELLAAMGIARSSFYASFGDKRRLYQECLAMFGERTIAPLRESTDECPTRVIRDFFEATLFDAPRHRVVQGCLLVNTVLEMTGVDDELAGEAEASLGKVEILFERSFQRAMQEGSFSSSLTPRALASYVMTINQGLRVQSRKNVSEVELRSVVETSLSLIGLSKPLAEQEVPG